MDKPDSRIDQLFKRMDRIEMAIKYLANKFDMDKGIKVDLDIDIINKLLNENYEPNN